VSGRRTRRVARAARVRAIVLPSESRLGCIGAGRDRSPASGEDPLVVGDPEALYFMLDRLFIEPDIYRVDAVSRDRRTPFRPR
jgi:hypothetical protein